MKFKIPKNRALEGVKAHYNELCATNETLKNSNASEVARIKIQTKLNKLEVIISALCHHVDDTIEMTANEYEFLELHIL